VHTDARSLADGTSIDADLCIVGAGAAGISIALAFIGAGRRVVLLEGGGFDREEALQARYRGEISGLPYFPLDATRLHYFGGTTGHWGGFCAPLDPIDFERRDWIDGSGWPISAADLAPWYAKAHPLLDLGPNSYDPAWWVAQDPAREPLPLDHGVVHEKIWQFSPPTRFGSKYRERLERAPDVHLFTHANVVALTPRDGGSAVDTLTVRQLDGRTATVRAARVVLACSTMQNVRLLLSSTAASDAGIGNGYDQVGRHFMEHLEMPIGTAALLRPQSMALYAYAFGRTPARAELVLSAETQRRLRTLNASVALEALAPGDTPLGSFEANPPADLEDYRRSTRDSLTDAMRDDASPHDAATIARRPRFALAVRQEQAPNPASRVTLSRERDALGVPRANFHWALTSLDRRSLRTLLLTLGQEFGRHGIGRVQLRDWLREAEGDWPATVSGGWHDLGATRMSATPRTGVVDANCQVHGVSNLFLAGGGVFTTAGCANPTLNIVALALRLADHLRRT
jgi:choline dehydrogenase-like flavoprotein